MFHPFGMNVPDRILNCNLLNLALMMQVICHFIYIRFFTGGGIRLFRGPPVVDAYA